MGLFIHEIGRVGRFIVDTLIPRLVFQLCALDGSYEFGCSVAGFADPCIIRNGVAIVS